MAITYRSSSTTGTGVNVTSRAPTVPSGAAAGDVVIVVLNRWLGGSNPAVTMPAGFTKLAFQALSSDSAGKIDVFWKRLTGADAGSYTFSWTGSMWSTAHAIALIGTKTAGDPVSGIWHTWSGTAGTFGTTTVTTAYDPCLIWAAYNDTAGTHTPPTNFTEVQDVDIGALAYRIPGASGVHTAPAATASTSSPAAAVLVAVEPDTGGTLALRGEASNAITGAAASVTVNTPASTVAGDLVLLIQMDNFYTLAGLLTPTGTAVSGWTLQHSRDGGSNIHHTKVWTGTAVGAGAQTVLANWGASNDHEKYAQVFVIRNAAFDVAASGAQASSTTYTTPDVTATGIDDLLIASVGPTAAAGLTNYTMNAAMTATTEWDISGVSYRSAYQGLIAAGATGTRTHASSTARAGQVVTVAIKSAGGAAPTGPVGSARILTQAAVNRASTY